MEQVLERGWRYGGGGARSAASFVRDFNSAISHEQRLKQVRFIAGLMDDRFRVPGTGIRFGFDSIAGLVPGVGDALTGALALIIVHHAWQAGVPRGMLARMLGNVGIDFVMGSIPVLGELFDFVFKANRANALLLEKHLAGHPSRSPGR